MQTRSKTDTFSLPTHRFDAAMFYSSSERQKLGRKSSKKHKRKTDSAKEPRSNIMVLSALKELGGVRRKAVSRQKIVSYVAERFTPGPRLLRAVKMTVRKLVGAGKVVQVSGAGANGSFRLPKPLPPDKTKVGRLLCYNNYIPYTSGKLSRITRRSGQGVALTLAQPTRVYTRNVRIGENFRVVLKPRKNPQVFSLECFPLYCTYVHMLSEPVVIRVFHCVIFFHNSEPSRHLLVKRTYHIPPPVM